jgi:hypothetical protein
MSKKELPVTKEMAAAAGRINKRRRDKTVEEKLRDDDYERADRRDDRR